MKTLTQHISQVKNLHSLNEYINEKLIINKDYKNVNDIYDIIKNFCDKNDDVIHEYEIFSSSGIQTTIETTLRDSRIREVFFNQTQNRINDLMNIIKKFNNYDEIYKFRHGTKKPDIFDKTYEIIKNFDCFNKFFKSDDFVIEYMMEDNIMIMNIGKPIFTVTFIGINN